MTDRNPILLETKLHRPPITRGLINRWRLLERLNSDIGCPLTLVCAPAGFGKTTLVCNWLEQLAAAQGENAITLPYAWLSLDENDSDITLFLHYVIAALRTVYADAGADTLALLDSPQQPPPEVLHTTFRNELEKLPGEVILVLDDYQLIQGQDVHNLLFELTRHWPIKLHLVLISRIDPPLPITSLRAKGMTTEIRTKDLRFTPQEAAAYLSQAQLAPLDQTALQVLEERFEGWPAGLHLAALTLRAVDSPDKVLSTLSSHNPNITGYLVDEVLAQQLPEVHAFLLQTSILGRFCESLCAAVTGEVETTWNARACLDWIERADLFIIPLDDRREWYRYHHLFQQLLQQKLAAEITPEQIADLHRRASAWFAGEGRRDEAIQHALAAGDLELAARQMKRGLRDATNQEDRPTLERWLRVLPEEMIQRDPELLMLRAWVLEFSWRLDLQTKVLEQVEALLGAGTPSLPEADLRVLHGQLLTLRAQHAYFQTQTETAIEFCRQALALLPASWQFVRGGAMLYLGMSLFASGRIVEAEDLFIHEYEACRDKSDNYALLIQLGLCIILLNSGRLAEVGRMAQMLHEAATTGRVAIQMNWADWFRGIMHYQRNELEAAAHFFTQILEDRYTAQITTYRDAVAGLVLVHQLQGREAEALKLLEMISAFDLQESGGETVRTRSLRARLMLLQGDLDGAGQWAESFSGPPPDNVLLWLEEPEITRVRVLLAHAGGGSSDGAGGDLWTARRNLDVLYEITERTHNTRYRIEVMAMRALVLEALGHSDEAENDLKQAVELARPGGFIRVFADLGQPMQAMLRRLAGRDHLKQTIQRILAAFPEDDRSMNGHEVQGGHPALVNLTLVEHLTPRELEVLALLQEPLGIKEIALQLNISRATASRHTINIYGKLGVNRRWDAIAQAKKLGILSP